MRAVRLVVRALRLKCPNCGGGGLFRRWFAMAERCPSCGLHLERHESGYAVGAYMFNIAAAEGLAVAVMVGLAALTWPDPPWDLLLYGGVALMIVAPMVFYPFAKTLFLAFDLAIRPVGDE